MGGFIIRGRGVSVALGWRSERHCDVCCCVFGACLVLVCFVCVVCFDFSWPSRTYVSFEVVSPFCIVCFLGISSGIPLR